MNRPDKGSVTTILFSEKNYTTLQTVLVQDFEERNGSLTPQQVERLGKTLDHYMHQVYEKQGEKPVQLLNREVLTACSKDFAQYLQRKTVIQDKNPIKHVIENSGLFQDTSQRYERITQERNEVKALPPSIPDFRISLKEDGPPAAEMYEIAKKQREAEILRANQQANELMKADRGLQSRIAADSTFQSQQDAQNRNTELVLSQRNKPQPMLTQQMDTTLAVLPDRRDLMMKAIGEFEEKSGSANGNNTIIHPVNTPPILSQQVLIPHADVVSYREIENNLFIYSADRDWLRNNKENRYNFTVNFDPAANGQSFGPTLSSQQKFKNIVRIELVKTILPGENLNVVVQRRRNVQQTDTSYQDNILNLPFITLRVAELDNNNNFGTDNFLDRSFGVLQYDEQWLSDVNQQTSTTRGFLAMIPKFLKCQKEYYPTPLSTLQKLSIDLRRPNGELISATPDTFDIGGILAPQNSETISEKFPFNNAIKYTDTTLTYNMMVPAVNGAPANFFINTVKYFSKFEISAGDRVQIAGYTYSEQALNDPTYGPALRDFCGWINRPEGHIVLGFCNTVNFNPYADVNSLIDGFNEVGYANFLVIQARYTDPTTGNIQLQPFGTDFGAVLNAFGVNLQTPVRLMNMNKQLTVVFRIITREMDSLPQLRPNNNY